LGRGWRVCELLVFALWGQPLTPALSPMLGRGSKSTLTNQQFKEISYDAH
jgi:hypothetical protein